MTTNKKVRILYLVFWGFTSLSLMAAEGWVVQGSPSALHRHLMPAEGPHGHGEEVPHLLSKPVIIFIPVTLWEAQVKCCALQRRKTCVFCQLKMQEVDRVHKCSLLTVLATFYSIIFAKAINSTCHNQVK